MSRKKTNKKSKKIKDNKSNEEQKTEEISNIIQDEVATKFK